MTSIDEATALHEVAAHWTLAWHPLEHSRFEDLSRSIGRLAAQMEDVTDDSLWGPMLRTLKRLRWEMSVYPLPSNHPGVGIASALEGPLAPLTQLGIALPDAGPIANHVHELLIGMSELSLNPLGEAVEHATLAAPAPHSRVSVVLPRGRLLHEVEAELSKRGIDAEVVVPAQLRRMSTQDLAVLVGLPGWFPAEVFRAPTATRYVAIHFAWIRDRTPRLTLLPGRGSTVHSGFGATPPRRVPDASPSVESSELVPTVDWTAITAAARHNTPGLDAVPVPARLFVLASSQGVYLEADDRARAYVARVGTELEVAQVPVNDAVVGDHLVIRTKGDGDYIRVFADQLLGSRAHRPRQLQDTWTRELNRRVHLRGIGAFCTDLRGAGASRATPGNVRRWCRDDTMGPGYPEDFGPLMRMLGFGDEEQAIWGAMQLLRKTHVAAAVKVRMRLEQELAEADTDQLLAAGWVDVDAEEIEGEGALRIARIEAISPDIEEVPCSRTRRPFDLEADTWLG